MTPYAMSILTHEARTPAELYVQEFFLIALRRNGGKNEREVVGNLFEEFYQMEDIDRQEYLDVFSSRFRTDTILYQAHAERCAAHARDNRGLAPHIITLWQNEAAWFAQRARTSFDEWSATCT